ncbi:MAG TPA: GTPase HflX [Vicinamibacterales bacterium]|nr:GTPase HflX [Vicinamibacterales bacterium]
MNQRSAAPQEPVDRAALVSLIPRTSRVSDPEVVLDELAGLARAAGATVVLTVTQEREGPDRATLIGSGKAETLARGCEETGATVVIVDNPISPAQARNLEKIVGRRVIDRTALILDIFARRARTREGQLQVELAQLEYLLPRLAGSSTALSRLGAGIGTRGPGETKLETDRRRIRQRISTLKTSIADVKRRRGYLRARRRRTDVPVVALVGYTNAGKTTLFNRITGATEIASDALFVTLDPVVRRVRLGDQRQVLVSDTVGFIDRLPHELVAAFHATLEEVASADLVLHVLDGGALDVDRRADAVRRVLAEVGASAVPTLDVINKTDRLSPDDVNRLAAGHRDAAFVSAVTGDGIEALVATVVERLDMDARRMTLRFAADSAEDTRLVAELYRVARVVSHETGGGEVAIEADVPRRLMARFLRERVPA